jgi:hypothetical protein
MIEWELILNYKRKRFRQKATVEYASKQILRIRVTGSKNSLLLENDYPKLYYANSKRGMKWKIRDGQLIASSSDPDAALLLNNIFTKLEYLVKKDIKLIFPEENWLQD